MDTDVDNYCKNFQSNPHRDEESEAFKKVDEISKLIAALSSQDKNQAADALKKAEQFLGVDKDVEGKDLFDEDGSGDKDVEAKIRVKQNKTVINQKAFDKFHEDKQNGNNMSQDAFMRSVEEDAQRRANERKERQNIADKHKKNGNQAFKSGNYEAALVQYDKAIDQVKDSPLLYTNRALTLLHLELYDQVLPDCEKVLKLNEHNLKAHLYKAKAMFCLGDQDKAKLYIRQIMDTYPKHRQVIENYTKTFVQEE